MKIALMTGWLSNRGGGVSAVVAATARALARTHGISVHVLGLSLSSKDLDDYDWGGAEVHAIRAIETRVIGFSPAFDSSLAEVAPDVAHVHGLWAYPSIAAERWRRRGRGRPVVISPHGMLDPWALKNSAWKKRVAGAAFQRGALTHASAIHALTETERCEITDYVGAATTTVIPNGVDIPVQKDMPPRPDGLRRLLYLGRLHPKKNLHGLLDAWASAGAATAGWQLDIAGWDQNGTEALLREQAMRLGIGESVHFLGALFGAEKDLAYKQADGFVLPSLSEGLPMVVLEAWSHGSAVLMTDSCNLKVGFTEGAAKRMETVPEGAARDLAAFLKLGDDERAAIGHRGRALATQMFSWNMVAASFVNLYHWSLGEAPAPDDLQEGTRHVS